MPQKDKLDRLKKIKEFIEQKEAVEEAPPVKVSEIVSRIKGKLPPIAPASSGEMPVFRKREGTGGAGEKPFDFKKQLVGASSLTRGLYSVFHAPIDAIAVFLASLPASRDLRDLLDSAGVNMSAEAFLIASSATALFAGILVFIAFGTLALALNDTLFAALAPLAAFIVLLFVAFSSLFMLVAKANARAVKIDRALPFALRQISTQIRAGVSFHKAIVSVAGAGYGVLSDEFKKLLSDLERGLSTDEALMRLARRTRSKSLKRAVTQIVRSFKTGGNLSDIINDIAQDVSFETRMKIRDFTEKLNFVNILFIMVAVVAPVAATIISAILQIPLFAAGLPPYFIYLAFGGIAFGMIVIVYLTKQMEPAAW
ncbi:type II secretion system F family protein [Candidatus Micrarchaeota archaeon]|nr:type II secretion system F family protein [Candidatus Micrarchaeota archaeon]